MGKVSGFVIGMLLLGFIMTGFGMYMGSLANNNNTTYNSSTIDLYKNEQKFVNMSEELKSKTLLEANENSSGNIITNSIDLLGDFFKAGYNSIIITKDTLNTFDNMAEASTKEIGAPIEIKTFMIALVALIFVFAIIAILVNKDV